MVWTDNVIELLNRLLPDWLDRCLWSTLGSLLVAIWWALKDITTFRVRLKKSRLVYGMVAAAFIFWLIFLVYAVLSRGSNKDPPIVQPEVTSEPPKPPGSSNGEKSAPVSSKREHSSAKAAAETEQTPSTKMPVTNVVSPDTLPAGVSASQIGTESDEFTFCVLIGNLDSSDRFLPLEEAPNYLKKMLGYSYANITYANDENFALSKLDQFECSNDNLNLPKPLKRDKRYDDGVFVRTILIGGAVGKRKIYMKFKSN